MPEAPALVAAGSTSLLLSWAAPEAFEALEVELRRSAWAWPLSAPWVRQATAPEDVRITDRFVEVTLRGLEPSTAYEVRIAAACEEGPRQVGPAAAFRTLAVAPPLLGPPSASCCRHDRLLLQWVEPAVQADEVIAYRVRYWDCEQRWPTKVEVEAKLTSRLLPPSQQTAQFLGGQAAMRIPRPPRGGVAARPEDAAAVEEDAGSEVHLWLMSLAPLRMYIVQVAAVTAAGTGEWSPKSTELFTWRSAPDLLPASRVCRTHSALALGLAVEPVPDGTEGQDEEVERFEVVVRPVQSGRGPAPDAAEVVVTAAEAAELALRLAGGAPSPGARPHAVAVRGLQPRSIYRCTARAITHAGVGSWSPAVELETLAVPPDVDDLRVDEADHCSAVLSWRVLDECPQAGLLRALLGEEEAERELWARRLVGFRVRSGGPAAGALKEILGARSRPAPDGRHRLALRDLAPNSAYQVEVAAAARGSEDGTWSGPVQVLTEGLAPGVPAPALLCASRRGAAVHWAAPDAAAAAVLGYVVQLRRRPEHRGRPPDPEERAFPLAGAGEGGEAASRDVAICDGSSTRVELRDLEPGATYLVQVAARTARGVGSWSEECLVSTRSRAPAMSQEAEPRLLHAYYDKLVLLCGGPVPDWPPEEASDVTGYRVRYFECSRSGWHGAWVEPAPHHLEVTETEDQAGCPAVQVCLRGLAPERQHVVQVAAVTAAGQGPWSPQSGRLSTWRVAPRMALPRVLFRTHEALVLGWTQDFQELEAGSADGTAHDEDIAEFLVRAAPSSAGRAEAKTVRASCAQAQALAAAWRDRLASEPEQVERQGLWRQRSRSGSADAVRCGPRWPDTMLCEAENDQWSPAFVAVVRGLAHGSGYSCTVSAASRAGEGQCSAASGEVSTLALAPVVEDARVDEVQHDQILISWELPQREPPLPPAAAEQLGLVGSLEELSLQGFSVRCAAWASWTRLSWREPCYTEVDALQSAGDAGRVHFALLDLEAASQYVAEVRAHSACGAGEWLRVGDQPICTAIVAEPPEKPELVYATSHALTFSFDGVEDRRVTAYEARRHERIAGTWTRASKPLKFDRNTIAVRVTPENRWVVKLDQLRSASDYAIQLRGITSTGGITKWSALSEFMRTRDDDGEADVDEGVGVHDASPASTASKQERAAAEQEKARQEAGIESVDDLARKLEAVLSVTMDYATRGVSLPGTKGIPPIAEEADELLKQHNGDRRAAIMAAVQREDEASWQTKLRDFLIQQVPVVGCSTLLLKELWRTIRNCALIAQLHGHDTRSAETQAKLLLCLVPSGAPPASSGGAGAAAGAASSGAGAAAGSLPLALSTVGVEDFVTAGRNTALFVSRALAKETLVRATGLRLAGTVVEMLEGAGRLLRNDGSAGDQGTSGALTRQTSKDAVRPEAESRRESGMGEGAIAFADDDEQPSPMRVARVVFRPQSFEEKPMMVLGLVTLWQLPVLVSVARFVAARLLPLLARRVQMELPLAGVLAGLIVLQAAVVWAAIWVHQNLDTFMNVPATLIFVIYSIVPAVSTFLAVRSIVKGAEEAPFFVLLGVYNLASGYLRWADDLGDDARLERRTVHPVVYARPHVRSARRALWVLLLADFVAEELLGRVCNLHSLRLFGPPLDDGGATLVEYRTVAFAIGLLAAWAQARVLELLQRRTVLLRLLGARNAIYAGLTLMLMGAYAVVQQARSVAFLREVSPGPRLCCLVLWIRHFGAIAGAVAPLAFYVLLHPRCLGSLSKDALVPVAMAVGGVLGHLFCSTFNALWAERREHLESDYRVLQLFPHMSSQARSKASVAMRLALAKSAQVTKNAAVEWAATRMVRSLAGYVAGSLTLGAGRAPI